MESSKLFFLCVMTIGLLLFTQKEQNKPEPVKEKLEADGWRHEKVKEGIEDNIDNLKARLADDIDRSKTENPLIN